MRRAAVGCDCRRGRYFPPFHHLESGGVMRNRRDKISHRKYKWDERTESVGLALRHMLIAGSNTRSVFVSCSAGVNKSVECDVES